MLQFQAFMLLLMFKMVWSQLYPLNYTDKRAKVSMIFNELDDAVNGCFTMLF